MNRVGREAWRSGSWASRLRTYRHGLRLVAAQRKRHGEFATGLDRELTRRTTALPQRAVIGLAGGLDLFTRQRRPIASCSRFATSSSPASINIIVSAPASHLIWASTSGFCVTPAMFCQKAMILLSEPLMSMTRSR
jgi:hypothetical protein